MQSSKTKHKDWIQLPLAFKSVSHINKGYYSVCEPVQISDVGVFLFQKSTN